MRARFANRYYLQYLPDNWPDAGRLKVPWMSLNGDAVQAQGGKCLHNRGIDCHPAATAAINTCGARPATAASQNPVPTPTPQLVPLPQPPLPPPMPKVMPVPP